MKNTFPFVSAFALAMLAGCSDGPTPPHPDAPRVIDFTSNVSRLTSGESVTFRTFVGDRDGDLLGGSLKDASGVSYGTFEGPGTDGTWGITLTWEEIQNAVSIDFTRPIGRIFRAEFVDAAGRRGVGEVSVELHCGSSGACRGTCGLSRCGQDCVDLENDDDHCGTCGNQCLPGTCDQRVCSCDSDSNCPGSTQCFPDPVESPAKQCQALGNTRLVGTSGAGARSGRVEVELDGVWTPVCGASFTDGDVGTLICRDLFSALGTSTVTSREQGRGLTFSCDDDANSLRYCRANLPDGGCSSQLLVTCGDTCTPSCGDRECGSDGCGGNCGNCSDDFPCIDGFCGGCQPDCSGRNCGPDGCGGSCGRCPDGTNCGANDGRCYAPPITHVRTSGQLGDMEFAYYTIALYDGYDIRIIATGSQWLEVYVRVGSRPTTDVYDAMAPVRNNQVELDFEMPRAGTLHIGVFSIFETDFRIDTYEN